MTKKDVIDLLNELELSVDRSGAEGQRTHQGQ